MLDDNGLSCCGSHTAMDLLSNEKLAATMEYHRVIGNKFIIVPWLDINKLKTKDACMKMAATFNEIADKTRSKAFTSATTHASDFAKIENETFWDLLFGNTNKEICMQIDTGNCIQGGGDPIAILKKYPGRSCSTPPQGILRHQQKS